MRARAAVARRPVENDLLAGLSDQQRAVVLFNDGPAVVSAVAGSGKTRCVVHRIARLVRDGVSPAELLAVTFTKAAAAEMNARLEQLGVGEARVGTLHSVALEILRRDDSLRRLGERKVAEDGRAQTMLKEVLGHRGMRLQRYDLTRYEQFLGACKAHLIAPEESGRWPGAAGYDATFPEAYFRYEEAKDARGLLDFDDMVYLAARALRDDAGVRARWSGRWSHVICDEAQDNSPAQWVMIRALAGSGNLMVVGDGCQAIYGWRSAVLDEFLSFARSSSVLAVPRNYRSGQSICAAASALVRGRPWNLSGDVVPNRDEAGSIVARCLETFDEEAEAVGEDVVRARAADGARWSDFVVLYRTAAQSRAIEEALLRRRVPYRVVGGVNFYERKEVRDLLAYLRALLGRREGVLRACNAPFRFLGAAFLADLEARLPEQFELGALRRHMLDACGQSRQRGTVEAFLALLDKLRRDLAEQPPAGPGVLLATILRETGYLEWLLREEGSDTSENSRASNVRELVRCADKFASLVDFLSYVDETIAASRRRGDARGDLVTLMTIHRSKGLEFPTVFVVGVNERILPHARATDEDEERRLAYVAVTRARERCVLSCVTHFAGPAGVVPAVPSRYLAEMGLSVESPACAPS